MLAEKRYRKIIEHDNFNPRLIQFITDAQRLPNIRPTDYWPHIEKTLRHPEAVWQHVYDAQLDDVGRLLLQLVVLNGGRIGEDDLRAAYGRFVTTGSGELKGREDFIFNLRVAVGSVLNRKTDRGGHSEIELFNPSIADYVLGRIANDAHCLGTRLVALSTISSCDVLRALLKNKITRATVGRHVIGQLLNATQTSEDLNYRIVVGHLAAVNYINAGFVRAALKKLIGSIVTVPADFTQYARLCGVIRRSIEAGVVEADVFGALLEEVRMREAGSFDEADLASMAALRHLLPDPEGAVFEEFLRPAIVEYWSNAIAEHVAEQQLLAELYDESEFFRGEQIVRAEVKEILDEYGLEFSPLDVITIGEWVDVTDVILANQQNIGDEDYEYRESSHGPSGPDAIDDMFDVDLPKS